MSELPIVEQVNAVMRASIPLMESCRIEIAELEPGYARTTAPFEGNGNHLGTMYAGVLFSVAEVVGGVMAAVTFDMAKYLPVVKSVNIDFKRPARSDVSAGRGWTRTRSPPRRPPPTPMAAAVTSCTPRSPTPRGRSSPRRSASTRSARTASERPRARQAGVSATIGIGRLVFFW